MTRFRRGLAGGALLLALTITGPWVTASPAVPAPAAQSAASLQLPQPPGTNRLISSRPDGTFGGAHSKAPAVSANGRFVAFASADAGLVAGTECQPGDSHQYLHDRHTESTALVDLGPDGLCGDAESTGQASISADGRYVAFASTSSGLVADGSNGPNVFVRDTVGSTTTIVSRAADGGAANGPSWDPDLSADGTTVVFTSTATNLLPVELPTAVARIFAHDLVAGTTQLVSKRPNGKPTTQESQSASVSGDGAMITYETRSPAVAGGHRHGVMLVLFDATAGTSSIVSATRGRRLELDGFPQISADGGTVVYTSEATDLVPGDANGSSDIFSHDVLTGAITLISRSLAGGSGNASSSGPSVDAVGGSISFVSAATDLVGDPVEALLNVYRYDGATGVISVVSHDWAGGPADDWSLDPAISGDGSLIAFTSHATDIVRQGFQNRDQIYGYRVF